MTAVVPHDATYEGNQPSLIDENPELREVR
jgi:hypothetical protein